MPRILLPLVALAGAGVVAILAWVAAASLVTGPGVLRAVALAAFLLSGHLFLRVARPRPASRGRLAWLTGGALAYMTVAHLFLGTAPSRELGDPPQPPGVTRITGHDGVPIAMIRAGAGHAGTPVVWVHGGPGTPVLPGIAVTGSGPLDLLVGEGFAVVYYDQRGAGLSGRVDLARGGRYRVADHVADLEAVREALGVDRIILAGHGWGSTLATRYALVHPSRVEGLVLLAPAPAWYPAFPDMASPSARARLTEMQASALALFERPPPRLVLGRLTASTSRRAAHTLVQDWEADQWWTRATWEGMRRGQPNLLCSTDPERHLTPPTGLGYFAHSYTLEDALRLPDDRGDLAALELPILIVRGLCDHIRWEVSYEYLDLLPGAQYVSIPAGGHLLWVEQPELLRQVIPAFLRGEVVPLSYYHPRGGGSGN
jgi:pimeloyl-ACP methyl ester carboxylesterase